MPVGFNPGFDAGRAVGLASAVDRSILVWPHRTGTNVQPENSLQGVQALAAARYGIVDVDCYVLADGACVVMHDTTIDRTSSGTGAVSTFLTLALWQTQVLDPQTWFGSGYTNEVLPVLSAMLAAYPDAFWSIEAKNSGAGAAIVAALQLARIPPSRGLVWASTLSELTPARAAGYQTGVVAGAIESSVSSFVDWVKLGITHVCFSTAGTGGAQAILRAQAAGLRVHQYTLTRRTEKEAARVLQVNGIFADEPQYLSTVAPIATASTWASTNRFMPGMLPDNSNRGFITGNRWSPGAVGDIAQAHTGALMGWACPLVNAAGSYAITWDFSFSNVANAGRWGGIAICRSTDAQYSNGVTDSDPCYEILWRQSGSLEIYRRDSLAASALVTNFGVTPFTLGVTYTLTLAVTPTSITLTRASNGDSVTYAHVTYRGGYFHLGRNGAAMTIGSVVVS